MLGGGGPVGFAAIQFAVASGCAVTATCGSHDIDRILAAGAVQAVDRTVEVMMGLVISLLYSRLSIVRL